MDVCPTSFSTSHPLLPRLIPVGTAWAYADPDLTFDLQFSENMDQTATPPTSSIIIEVDGVEKEPDNLTWQSATNILVDYAEAVLGPTVVRCRFSAKHDDFLSVAGELVTPFDILIPAP